MKFYQKIIYIGYFSLVTICLRLFPKHRLGVLTLITVGNISSGRTLTGCAHWLCYQGLAVLKYSFALAALPMNPSVACKIRDHDHGNSIAHSVINSMTSRHHER